MFVEPLLFCFRNTLCKRRRFIFLSDIFSLCIVALCYLFLTFLLSVFDDGIRRACFLVGALYIYRRTPSLNLTVLFYTIQRRKRFNESVRGGEGGEGGGGFGGDR